MSHGLHTAKNSDLFAVTTNIDWKKPQSLEKSTSKAMTSKLKNMQLKDEKSYKELLPNFEKINRARQKISRNAAKTVL